MKNLSPLPTIILFFSPLLQVRASNDWSKPCLSGTCSWDIPTSSTGGASGTLKIWGANTAIADITTAAGWEILSCAPSKAEQDVRIMCKDPDGAGCQHLFATSNSSSTGGSEENAVGKIVRLPDDCGKGPFARIAGAWVAEDQSVPKSVARWLMKRDGGGEPQKVRMLRLDMKFGEGDVSKIGKVNFALVGANVPGAAAKGDLDTSTVGRKRSRVYGRRRRGFGDFVGGAIDTVQGAAGDAVDSVKGAAKTVGDAAGDAVDSVKDAAGDAVDSVKGAAQDANNVSVDKTKDLDPIDLNKTFNLVDQDLDCGNERANVKIDVESKVHALVTVGVAASGTLVPPKIDDFGLTGSLTADLDGAVVVDAGVGGTLDSGKIKLFELGIPGLDFPGVLSIGPSFQVNGQAKASLDLDVNMRVGINYQIEKAKFVFPQGGDKGGTFTPGDTPVKLSVAPSAKATGTVEAHLIPSLNFGISALDGTVDAGVFVELDTSASMTVSVGGSVDGLESRDENYFAKRAAKKAAGKNGQLSGAAGGCFEIDAGLDVNVGADADFFGLFDASTKLPLFSKNFELFKKCFGDQSQVGRRRSLSPLERRAFNLECTEDSSLESLADELVAAAQIVSL